MGDQIFRVCSEVCYWRVLMYNPYVVAVGYGIVTWGRVERFAKWGIDMNWTARLLADHVQCFIGDAIDCPRAIRVLVVLRQSEIFFDMLAEDLLLVYRLAVMLANPFRGAVGGDD